MNAVFYITFYFGLGDTFERQAFYIDGLTTAWEEMEEYLEYCAEKLEQKNYGQMDRASGSSGAGIKHFSCNCLIDQSISENIHTQVMEEWRQIVRDAEPHCVLGPVCTMDATKHALPDILQTTYQAYEHQHNQLLRERLVAHVNDHGSVVQSKKM